MNDKELLKYIDIIKYYNVLDNKYKIKVITDIKNKVSKELEK